MKRNSFLELVVGILAAALSFSLWIQADHYKRLNQQADDIKTTYEFIDQIIEVDSVQNAYFKQLIRHLPIADPLKPIP